MERERLLGAVGPVLAERGYAEMTTADLAARAGLDESEFQLHFADKRECVLVAHQRAFDRLSAELGSVCATEPDPARRLAAAIGAAIEFTVSSPEQARLLLLDALAVDAELAASVLDSNRRLAGMLRRGRRACPDAEALPELTEPVLVGAATSLIGGRLMAGEAGELRELEPQLVELMLLPYVGVEEARRRAREL